MLWKSRPCAKKSFEPQGCRILYVVSFTPGFSQVTRVKPKIWKPFKGFLSLFTRLKPGVNESVGLALKAKDAPMTENCSST